MAADAAQILLLMLRRSPRPTIPPGDCDCQVGVSCTQCSLQVYLVGMVSDEDDGLGASGYIVTDLRDKARLLSCLCVGTPQAQASRYHLSSFLSLATAQAQATNVGIELSQPNNSVTTENIGAQNAVFVCKLRMVGVGGVVQVTTTWTLQNFRSRGDTVLVTKTNFAGIFSIGGSRTPPGSLGPTYRDRITVVNFSEDLDNTVLMCGTGKQALGFFNLRVYSK